MILPPSTTGTSSLFQVTTGVGTPLTGHLMVMVVFEAAVALSPMFIVTGLPSPKGISRPGSGNSITGLTGSIWLEIKSQVFRIVDGIHQTRTTVFDHISKHREERSKYSAVRRIFEEHRGVWKCV